MSSLEAQRGRSEPDTSVWSFGFPSSFPLWTLYYGTSLFPGAYSEFAVVPVTRLVPLGR